MNITDDMNFDELAPSKSDYLSKADVGETGVIATIKGFTRATLKDRDGQPEEKTIMHFVENLKPMVLNPTCSKLIPICTGARNAGEARGKQVVVYNDPTVAFGTNITGGLRLKKVAAPAAPVAAPAAPTAPAPPAAPDAAFAASQPDPSDEIPF